MAETMVVAKQRGLGMVRVITAADGLLLNINENSKYKRKSSEQCQLLMGRAPYSGTSSHQLVLRLSELTDHRSASDDLSGDLYPEKARSHVSEVVGVRSLMDPVFMGVLSEDHLLVWGGVFFSMWHNKSNILFDLDACIQFLCDIKLQIMHNFHIYSIFMSHPNWINSRMRGACPPLIGPEGPGNFFSLDVT